MEDVEEVRRSESEAFWDRMLAAENALGGLIRPPEINIDSVRDAIISIASRYPHMLIHSVTTDAEGEWEVFNLGVLVEAHDDLVEFHTYDGIGRWEDAPRTIWYSSITRFQFDTRYANAF
jgi:hypothetical protein